VRLHEFVFGERRHRVVLPVGGGAGETAEVEQHHLVGEQLFQFPEHEGAPLRNLRHRDGGVEFVPELPRRDGGRVPDSRRGETAGFVEIGVAPRFTVEKGVDVVAGSAVLAGVERRVETHRSGEQFSIAGGGKNPPEVFEREFDANPQLLRQRDDEADVPETGFAVFAKALRHDVEERHAQPDAEEIAAVLGEPGHPEPVFFQNLGFGRGFFVPKEAEIEADRQKRPPLAVFEIAGIAVADAKMLRHVFLLSFLL